MWDVLGNSGGADGGGAGSEQVGQVALDKVQGRGRVGRAAVAVEDAGSVQGQRGLNHIPQATVQAVLPDAGYQAADGSGHCFVILFEIIFHLIHDQYSMKKEPKTCLLSPIYQCVFDKTSRALQHPKCFQTSTSYQNHNSFRLKVRKL